MRSVVSAVRPPPRTWRHLSVATDSPAEALDVAQVGDASRAAHRPRSLATSGEPSEIPAGPAENPRAAAGALTPLW